MNHSMIKFKDIANLFNVGGFAVFEFFREQGLEFVKDRWGRGSCPVEVFNPNDFVAYLKRQEHTYRGEVHKMQYLYRDRARYEEQKKCETDVQRFYRVGPSGTFYLITRYRDFTCEVKRWHTDYCYYTLVGRWMAVGDIPSLP